METRVRLLLVRVGYAEPDLNHQVIDPAAQQVFYLDLACPQQLRVAIEHDGEGHRLDRGRWQRDLHKDEVLHQLGWVVLRVPFQDCREPGPFFARLDAALGREHDLGA